MARRDADDIVNDEGLDGLDLGGADIGGLDGTLFLRKMIDDVAALVEKNADRMARSQPVIAFMADQVRFQALVDDWETDRGPIDALILRLKSLDGMSTPAGDLKSALAGAARARLRLVASGETEEDGDDLGTTLRHKALAGHFCPSPFRVSIDGVTKTVTRGDGKYQQRVTHSPLVITSRLHDLADDTELLELTWLRDGRWRSVVVDRAVACDARALLPYASNGMPIYTGIAGNVVQWLIEYEGRNIDQIDRGYSSRRMGWVGTTHTKFLLGERVMQAADRDKHRVHLHVDEGQRQLAEAIRPMGDENVWHDTMREAKQHPLLIAAVYGALAAFLIQPLDLRSGGLDISGTTGVGKTTWMQVGLSVLGPHKHLMLSWKSTAAGIEGAVSGLCDHVLGLDDSAKVPPHQREEVASWLYMICNGIGKMRGSVSGTLQRFATWRTFLLSNGEVPITSWSQDEGVRTRVLCIQQAPVPPGNRAFVKRLEAVLAKHNGWAAQRFVQWLVDNHDKLPDLRRRYEEIDADFAAGAQSDQHARLSGIVALLALVQQICRKELGWDWATLEPVQVAYEAAVNTELDKSTSALHVVRDWALSEQSQFYGRHDKRNPPRAWHGAWSSDLPEEGEGYGQVSMKPWTEIAILPRTLNAVLSRHGFQPEAILRDWRAKGYLSLDSRGKNPRHVVGAERTRCVCILREALERESTPGPMLSDPAPAGARESQATKEPPV